MPRRHVQPYRHGNDEDEERAQRIVQERTGQKCQSDTHPREKLSANLGVALPDFKNSGIRRDEHVEGVRMRAHDFPTLIPPSRLIFRLVQVMEMVPQIVVQRPRVR